MKLQTRPNKESSQDRTTRTTSTNRILSASAVCARYQPWNTVSMDTVYSRFFKLYIATAIAPVPLASFAGQPSSSIGIAFLKSYAAICLEGCVIVLACVIFSAFASSPPAIADDTLAAATIVWNYVGELIFNMLVLVGAIKMSDRIIRELMGLG